MSWFKSQNDSAAAAEGTPNFFPVTSLQSGFGQLTEKDTTWSCVTNKGFNTETQVWYSILEDGSFLLCQVIWSCLGVMFIPPTAQFTFKLYNPATKEQIWKSINTSGFKPNGRGCKANEFEIKHNGSPDGEESYTITANLDKNVQVSVIYSRPSSTPGFKLGNGETGGVSTFGRDQSVEKRDGFVVHRFLPFMTSSGSVVINGKIVDAKGDAMFVHAIQGMRPDAVATRWNFAFFTSGGGNEESKLGSVRAVQMEFQTTDEYGPGGKNSGRTKVNIGAVYASNLPINPLIVVGQTHLPSTSTSTWPAPIAPDVSSVEHSNLVKDKDTGYNAPGCITYKWAGERRDGIAGRVEASLTVSNLGSTLGEGGLLEKVDVLGEIPYVIRKGLAAVTGTKPYIYQYHNPATLEVELGEEKVDVKGFLFNEASFISE